jgi:hypothetical protein
MHFKIYINIVSGLFTLRKPVPNNTTVCVGEHLSQDSLYSKSTLITWRFWTYNTPLEKTKKNHNGLELNIGRSTTT